jgi:hypothetical protein
VVNLGLFLSAVVLLLYINRPSTDHHDNAFAWTKIRYVPQQKTNIPARGRCPGLSSTSKPILVVARTSNEDQQWLDVLKPKYHLCVYTADHQDPKSNELQTPANRGNEAMAYLTFIIDNYHDLPLTGMVFIHGSRFAWHNDHPDYDNSKLLMDLDMKSALKEHGYHNLKCDWGASTCSPAEALPQGSYETRSRAMIEPFNDRVVSDAALPAAFAAIFGGSRGGKLASQTQPGRHDAVRSQCCAQFVVARANVLQHTLEEYTALRQWLLEGSKLKGQKPPPGAAPANDKVAGRIMSYLWHILFLKHSPNEQLLVLSALNEAACPSASDCYCRLYGRCNLTCRKPGHCAGQYKLPPNFELRQKANSKAP